MALCCNILSLPQFFHANIVSCSKHNTPIHYNDHCSSIIPESTPLDPEETTTPFPPYQDGYGLGGDEILNNLDSSRFYHSSNDRRVDASLILQPSRITYGTLESLSSADDSSYFRPVSLLMFPLMDYTYTEVTKEAHYGCTGGGDVAKNLLSLPLSVSVCSIFSNQVDSFKLEYASVCNSTKTCSPLSQGAGFLPEIIRIMGYNKESIMCCCLSNLNSDKLFRCEDCSMRLSLRFPAVLSIRNTSSIVGHILSNKTSKGSGYFDTIRFHSCRSGSVEIPGLKYEYSFVDKAKKLYPKKQLSRSKGKQFPHADSHDMQFQMSIRNSKGRRSRWAMQIPSLWVIKLLHGIYGQLLG
ncbi:hypothetical protein RCOM_0519510 [Ricinus communis]|uniref:DUF2921 domain-containing protein n=1 Tax=Ricinus communis TaxID=3988 RepID=B9SRZ7_RICCO|nr:hypothetical protein RCOM_0519510 [Ricinus communis]